MAQDENETNNSADEKLIRTGSIFGTNNTTTVDSVTRQIGRGTDSTSVSAAYYGFNHRSMGTPLPKNKDHYGYTFFTKPRLRLSYDNLISDRSFALLNSKDQYSVARWIRATLDPVNVKDSYVPSPLVDHNNAFIPLLSNQLKSLSGWPDPTVDTYTSKEGFRKEQWVMADGFAKYHSAFNLNAEFANLRGSPITNLFYYWTQYAMLVHEGVFWPHLDSSFENEIDYQTRIYRLVMDSTKTYVVDIAATGVAFPLASGISGQFDFSKEQPYNDNNDTVDIPFQCVGAIYKDPILMLEFNKTVQAFNVTMHDRYRSKYYKQLTRYEAAIFNNFGYPRIDLDTGELQWWVSIADYNAIVKQQGVIE